MIEFEDDVRRQYYGLEPSRTSDKLELHRLTNWQNADGNPSRKFPYNEEDRCRFDALMAPEWKERFCPDKKRNRSRPGATLGSFAAMDTASSEGLQSKRTRVTEDQDTDCCRAPEWIDPHDPTFQEDAASPLAALVHTLASMDQKFPAARPRVSVLQGPGTAATAYSYYDGKQYLDVHTREPADFIRTKLEEGSSKATSPYMVAQVASMGMQCCPEG